jgi:dienelactone hydrolase
LVAESLIAEALAAGFFAGFPGDCLAELAADLMSPTPVRRTFANTGYHGFDNLALTKLANADTSETTSNAAASRTAKLRP